MALVALLLPLSMPLAQLGTLLAGGQETTIRFREGVPVYILYVTAWVNEDGTVPFLHDVHGRNQQLEPQRQKQLEHPMAAGRVSAMSAIRSPR